VRSRGPAAEYAHGSRSRNQVALTFHGAGDPVIARELLAIFAAHRAQVTVLAVGTWLESDRQIAREIVGGGHELGNHTYQHLDIDSLSAADARREIVRCRDLLVALVGSPGAHFRQSQSQTATPLVRRLAGAAGYPVCLSYDIDSLDYTDPGPSAVRTNVATARPGSIVSMHFGHRGTLDAMPHVLSDLADRGLRAVTATTLLAP
jgi:peptidoglycan/xylan/chitin deacetylase (PgdA/CDA1 family)